MKKIVLVAINTNIPLVEEVHREIKSRNTDIGLGLGLNYCAIRRWVKRIFWCVQRRKFKTGPNRKRGLRREHRQEREMECKE